MESFVKRAVIPDLGASGGALLSDELVQVGQAGLAVVQSFAEAFDGLIELPLGVLYLTELTACLREQVHNPNVTLHDYCRYFRRFRRCLIY